MPHICPFHKGYPLDIVFSLFDVDNKTSNFHHYFYAYGMQIRKDHIALYYSMVISVFSVWEHAVLFFAAIVPEPLRIFLLQ